jgi:hypothetical protein
MLKCCRQGPLAVYDDLMSTPEEVALALRGLGADGQPMLDPTTGQTTPFAFSGDPVRGTGWVSEVPGDGRNLIGSGPFTLAPGETEVVTVVWSAASEATLEASLLRIRERVGRARSTPSLWRF